MPMVLTRTGKKMTERRRPCATIGDGSRTAKQPQGDLRPGGDHGVDEHVGEARYEGRLLQETI